MLHIVGMGYCHPKTEITNQFLEDLNVGTNAQWIMEKIGIEKRLSTLPLDYIRETRNQDPRQALKVASMTPTDLGFKAAEMALERAGLSPDQIGLLICNTCTPNQTSPAEALRLASRLGCSKAQAYDVQTACPAFALHVDYLNSFREEALPDYVLCVSTAAMTQHVNYNDRTDGAIWGDGAAAWIVSRKEGRLRIIDSSYSADPSRCEAVVLDTFGYFHQDGRAVRDFSVRQTVRLIKSVELRYQIDWTRDVFIGHQANATMLEQITNNREIPPTNHWHNVRTTGNQAGAGAPASLAMNWEKIVTGQKIVVAVVGAGLSWGSVLLEAQ